MAFRAFPAEAEVSLEPLPVMYESQLDMVEEEE